MTEPAAGQSRRQPWQELMRFSAIGLVNTGIHLTVVVGLVEWIRLQPVAANGLAFGVANAFSFWANSHWTFRAAPTRARYLRFLCVSLAGLGLALAASALAAAQGWHYLAGVVLSFVLLPLLSFAANRLWTWREPTR
jgi:putative flippase GtrA